MTPRPILTAAEMRACEDAVVAAGTSVETLMERAGEGVAEAAWRFAGVPPTLIVCGPGNNGGDGYVAARVLSERGVHVRVAALGEPRTDAARAARAGWKGPVEDFASARPAPLLIDALFGTGLRRPLDPPIPDILMTLARAARLRIAVDLPSGVATDDGAVLSAVPDFDLTIALGSLKPAHRLQPAAWHCGRVAVVNIGLGATPDGLTEVDRPRLQPPGPADHKYSRGLVAVVGGAMPGASLLAATAAQRAGAGYVMLIGGAAVGGTHALVRSPLPEAAALADPRIGAIVVGPGLGRDDAAAVRLDTALAAGRPIVIDADGLTLLPGLGMRRLSHHAEPTILTPHEGEFVRLFGSLPGSKVDRARAAAIQSGAVVIVKGADTVVAAPDGRAAVAPPSPSWLASAGTGDVLAGIVGAMLARGMEPFQAAQAALWLHGEAARAAGPALIADDLLPRIGPAVAACA
jgi:hydroxyethylthiazole kinase-like uncharacterized protein yjeF